MLDFLRRQAGSARAVTATAGLRDGYRAASHWMSVDRVAAFGAIPVRERVVIDRTGISGGGVTAGIDSACGSSP